MGARPSSRVPRVEGSMSRKPRMAAPRHLAQRSRWQSRALAVVTAVLVAAGAIAPSAPAMAAGPTLVLSIDTTYAQFPVVSVSTSDHSVAANLTLTADDVGGYSYSHSCGSVATCWVNMPLDVGGDWTFTASADDATSVENVAFVPIWNSQIISNADYSVTLLFPAVGGQGSVFHYDIVDYQTRAPLLSGETTQHALTLPARSFTPGVEYFGTVGYDVEFEGSPTARGPEIPSDGFWGGVGAPQDFTAATSGNEAELTWALPLGRTTDEDFGYRVSMTNVATGASTHTDLPNTATSFSTAVLSGNSYRFSVVSFAVATEFGSTPAKTVLVASGPDPVIVSPPDAPSLSQPAAASGSLSIDLTSSSPGAASTVSEWQLGTLLGDGSVSWVAASPTMIGTTATFSNLIDGTDYLVRARARDATGASDWATTPILRPVSAPEAPVIDGATRQDDVLTVVLEVAHPSVARPVAGYLWEVSPLTGGSAGIWQSVSAVTGPDGYVIGGLDPAMPYAVRVAASNPVGTSAATTWVPSTTVDLAPVDPGDSVDSADPADSATDSTDSTDGELDGHMAATASDAFGSGSTGSVDALRADTEARSSSVGRSTHPAVATSHNSTSSAPGLTSSMENRGSAHSTQSAHSAKRAPYSNAALRSILIACALLLAFLIALGFWLILLARRRREEDEEDAPDHESETDRVAGEARHVR